MVDMSDITAMYGDTYASAANQKASMLQRRIANADYSKAADDELLDACKQFEAYFVEQMFKAMQKMVPESDHQSSYTKQMQSYFKDEMVQKLAKDSTETNGLGLAQTLYEQMKRNYNL